MIEYHEKAVEDFNVVIHRNPKNAHAHFRRAFSLKSLKVSKIKFNLCSDFQKLQPILKRLKSSIR
jgi:hypothetical protein